MIIQALGNPYGGTSSTSTKPNSIPTAGTRIVQPLSAPIRTASQIQPTLSITPVKPVSTSQPLIATAKNVWSTISSAVGSAVDLFIKKSVISPIPTQSAPSVVSPLKQKIQGVTKFISDVILPMSESRIQKEKDWLVKNYNSPITKGLVMIQQLAEQDYKNRPEVYGFTKGITQLAIGGTKSFNDYYNQERFIPDNPLGKARMAYGQIAEGVMEMYLGGQGIKAIKATNALLPVMFATIGQLKASDKTTIAQRLALLPKDLVTGWLFTKLPISEKTLSFQTVKGALPAGAINYASDVTGKLIEGMDAKTALKTSYASFIIGSLFHVANVATSELTSAKFSQGEKIFTPDEILSNASEMTNDATQKQLVKIALQAKSEGKDIKISVATAKESPAGKVVGKGLVETVTGQPQEIKLTNGEGVSGIVNVELVEQGAKIGEPNKEIEKTYYHGTSIEAAKNIEKVGIKPGSSGVVWVTARKDDAYGFKGTTIELKGDIKTIDIRSKEMVALQNKYGSIMSTEPIPSKILSTLKDQGYDGIAWSSKEVQVFNVDKLKTQFQLASKQEGKVPSKVSKKAVEPITEAPAKESDITLRPTEAKTSDEQIAEAVKIGLPNSIKIIPYQPKTGLHNIPVGYNKPTISKTDIKALLDNMPEFTAHPILTVIDNGKLQFKGKTSSFTLTSEALGVNPEKLKVGEKIKIDIQAIKKAPGIQQMRVFKGGESFASIGDYAFLKNLTEEKRRPDMPSYKKVPFPELVRVVKELTGKSPLVKKSLGTAMGRMYPQYLDIKLAAKIFSDPEVASRVLAHELGHLMDILPEGVWRKGNLLGRIASLNDYFKHYLSEFPGGLDETLTAKDKYRLKKEAKALAEIPVVETKEIVVGEKIPEPEEILNIWRMNTARIDNPELLAYIQQLSSELKKDIVKAAIKSQVPKWVTFKKQIKETITSGVIRNSPADIQRLYQQLLQEEIIKRRLLSLKIIRKELQALSAEWRPFNRLTDSPHYVEYRDRPAELYADAISVLYNDPERLKQAAPEFYRGFFNYLDQKPDVAATYQKIQDLLTGGTDEVNKARLEDLYKGFEEGATKRREIFEKEVEKKSFLFKAVTRHVTKFHPAYEKLNKLIKEGKITLSDKQKVRNVLEEMAMSRNDIWMDLVKNEEEVMKPLKKAGIADKELGAWFTLERNLNERLGIANPGGLIGNYAQELKDFLEQHFTPVQQEVLKEAVKKFHERTFAVAQDMYNEGMISEKVWKEKIEPYKDSYVTYGVVKYIEKDYVTPYVKSMTGTLEAIENPLVTTMYKRSSMLQAIAVHKGKVVIHDLLKKNFPDEITESQSVMGMRLQKIYREAPGKYALKLLEEGKWVSYDIDPYFEGMFKRFDTKDLHTIVELVGKFNQVFKPTVTTYKLGWAMYNNPVRDTQRTLRNLAAISKLEKIPYRPFEYLATWFKTIPEGFLFGNGELNQYAQMAVAAKAVSSPYVSHDPTGGEDKALATLYEKYHFLSSGKPLTRAAKIRQKLLLPVEIVLRALERLGSTFESTTKLAAFNYMYKKLGDTKQAAFYTRNYLGTPNYIDGGTLKGTDNNIMVFSNVIIQGMRTDLELMGNPKSRGAYFTEVFIQSGMWKLLMLALAGGFLGKKYQDMYKKIPEYNKTNYLVFPYFELPSGKVLWFQLPQDDINRLAGAIIWKSGTAMQGQLKKPGQLLDVGAGVFPTVTPIFDIIGAWIDYARGINPYDSYYGKNVLNIQTAQIRGIEGLKAMGIWTIGQVGLGNFATYDSSKDTTTEKIVRFTPLINRMFKISDYGEAEEAQEIQRKDQQRRAIQNKKEADIVKKYATQFIKQGGEEQDYLDKIEQELYPKGFDTKEDKNNFKRLIKDFGNEVAGKTESTKYKTIMNLNLNTSKIETLKRYKNEMDENKYTDLIDRLYEDKVISKTVYQEVR